MIKCDRCACAIEEDEKLTEAIECTVLGEDQTDIWDNANVWRFCKKCWDEMITFLASEGMLKL